VKHNLPFDAIAAVYQAALNFAARDEQGLPFPGDAQFRSGFISARTGTIRVAEILQKVSGLDSNAVADKKVLDRLMGGRAQ
jgi:hypothetical protein